MRRPTARRPLRLLLSLLAALALAPAAARAQAIASDSTWMSVPDGAITWAEVPFRPEVGARYRVSATVTQTQDGGGATTMTDRSAVAVEALNAEGYRLAFTTEDVAIGGAAAERFPALAEIGASMSGFTLVVQADSVGTPLYVVNEAEAVAVQRAAMDRMIEAMSGELDALDPAAGLHVRQMLEGMFAPEAYRQQLLERASLLTAASGGALPVGDTLFVSTRLPNMLGGSEPIPSVGYASVRSHGDGPTVVALGQTIDPEAARAVVVTMVRQMAEAQGADLTAFDPAMLPAVDIDEAATYTLDAGTGWPQSIEHVRTVRTGPARRVDRTVVESARLE